MRRNAIVGLLGAAMVVGCGGSDKTSADAAESHDQRQTLDRDAFDAFDALGDVLGEPDALPPTDTGPRQTTFGGSRPTTLLVPKTYDPANTYPLIITLHGYGSTAQSHLDYMGYGQLVDSKGILVTAPDGTDYAGTSGWNSIPEMSSPDDAGYLRSLIEEIKAAYNVDPDRVFISGHSAGGFMAYRMACEHADVVRGIVALSTSSFYEDKSACSPARPVSVLHIHGTADSTVEYDGGYVVPLNPWTEYPPVETTVEYWASYNGCQTAMTDEGTLDLEKKIAGSETTRSGFDCPQGVDVELWTIEGGEHIPVIAPEEFATAIVDWLLAKK